MKLLCCLLILSCAACGKRGKLIRPTEADVGRLKTRADTPGKRNAPNTRDELRASHGPATNNRSD